MKDELTVTLIAPDRKLFEGKAQMVSLPGERAAFSVLKSHAPLVSSLEPGVVTIESEEGKKTFIIDSGFAEVKNNNVTVLVEGAMLQDEINIEEEKKLLEEEIKKTTTSEKEYKTKEQNILKYRARIRAVS
ncbi:MAG: ATP synthase F1 subunit epsilon [Spirochaetia bacterium]|nr:ATP synthase F1 subunit epsilon [Spirochaetia bacterium]